MLGATAPDLPLRAEVAGDHYRVTIPLVGLVAKGAEPAITADVREEPDGRWRLDDARLPGAFGFSSKGTSTEVTIGRQHMTGVIDPSLSSSSIIKSEMEDIRTTGTGPVQSSEQRIARAVIDATLTPGSDGLLDVTERSTLEGWHSGAIGKGGIAAGTGIRHAEAEAEMKGIAPDRAAPAIQALVALFLALPDAKPGETSPVVTSGMQDALARLVHASRGLAGSFRMSESLEGLQLELAGIGRASAERTRLGLGARAEDGLLRAWLDIGMDGLSLGALPPGVSSLVPRRISLRPAVSGVPVDALEGVLSGGTGQDQAQSLEALFARGGLTISIDDLSFAIGPAAFSGAGSLLLLSPGEQEGQARITATGFEDLVQQAQNDPALADAAPVLTFVNGLAKHDGGQSIWTVNATKDGHVLVNGVDVFSLGGAFGGR